VSTTLGQKDDRPPHPRLVRIKANIPTHLVRLASGRDLAAIASGACAGSFDSDELRSDEEVALVARVFEEAREFADFTSDNEVAEHVRQTYRMSALIRELEDAGLWLFGAREVQRLEGGDSGPSSWPVSILRVVRAKNPEIIKINLDGSNQVENLKPTSPGDRDGDGGDV
jgi:hypothetical protein